MNAVEFEHSEQELQEMADKLHLAELMDESWIDEDGFCTYPLHLLPIESEQDIESKEATIEKEPETIEALDAEPIVEPVEADITEPTETIPEVELFTPTIEMIDPIQPIEEITEPQEKDVIQV